MTDSGILDYLLATRRVAHRMINVPTANNFLAHLLSFSLQDRSARMRILWSSFVPVFGPAAVLLSAFA